MLVNEGGGWWVAVASASLVAKRAALPKLYLKSERTALWMGKGDSQNVDWINRKRGARA